MKSLEKIGRCLLIACPNNGLPLSEAYRFYVSTWSVEELENLGFIVLGNRLSQSYKNKLGFLSIIEKLAPLPKPLHYISAELIAIKKTSKGKSN